MAGVPGEILDQEQVDKPETDIPSPVMWPGVVEFEVGRDHTGPIAGVLELGDHVGQRFMVGDNETAVATGGVAVARGFVQAESTAVAPALIYTQGSPSALISGCWLARPGRQALGCEASTSRGRDAGLPATADHIQLVKRT